MTPVGGLTSPPPHHWQRGLIDAVGSMDVAIDRAKQAANLSDAEIVGYQLGRGFRSNLRGATRPPPPPPAGAAGGVHSAAVRDVIPGGSRP
jgi:hypothetical protein